MNPETRKIKRALISVSDKSGIVEFAKQLQELGVEIYSTGGTYAALTENGIEVKKVSELTQFPEIMGGRVKTLHPNVHGGLLANLADQSHLSDMQEYGIESIDMLVVNLYPFEQTLEGVSATHEQLIEKIDIGGPAMLRAAAKNYKWTAVVAKPVFYDRIIELMKADGATVNLAFRKQLAAAAFSHTAYYDGIISNYMNKQIENEQPTESSISLKLAQGLRYGENPHQKATLYGKFNKVFNKLHGKELSYNNILDIDASAKLIMEFDEPSCVITKHTNPCGVASMASLSEAFEAAFATDTVSPFGGIISFNRKVDIEAVMAFDEIFTEVVIAPDYDDEALQQLFKKKNRRIIKADFDKMKDFLSNDLRAVVGGYLMQEADSKLYDEEAMQVVTKRRPSASEMQALLFNWKVAKHVKSNAVVYGTADRTLGIGAGQMSRVFSSRIAIDKAREMKLSLKGSVVASDAFFPFADGLIEAAKSGATAVIQPGGSVRDEEVIAAADENNIAMVFTGMRHFRH